MGVLYVCSSDLRVTYEHDAVGNRTRAAYWVGESRAMIRDGYAVAEYTYDTRSRVIKESYYDTSLKRVMTRKGFSAIGYIYDNADHTLQVRYMDTRDKLVRLPEGFSVWQREYDRYGHVILEQYLDEYERIASLLERAPVTRREVSTSLVTSRKSAYLPVLMLPRSFSMNICLATLMVRA